MERDINKIIEEVLASLALENLTVSKKKIDEVRQEHQKPVRRRILVNDRRR